MKDHYMFTSAIRQFKGFKRDASNKHKYSIKMLDTLLRATYGHSIFTAMTKQKWRDHLPSFTDECPLVIVYQEFSDLRPDGCYLIYHKQMKANYYGVQFVFRKGLVEDAEFEALADNFMGNTSGKRNHFQILSAFLAGRDVFYPNIMYYLFYVCTQLYRLDPDTTPENYSKCTLLDHLHKKSQKCLDFHIQLASEYLTLPPQPNTQLALLDAYEIVMKMVRSKDLAYMPFDQWPYTVTDMRRKYHKAFHRTPCFNTDDLECARRVAYFIEVVHLPSRLRSLFKCPMYIDDDEYNRIFWDSGSYGIFNIRNLSQMNLQSLLQAANV
jgi:hypothetical protein